MMTLCAKKRICQLIAGADYRLGCDAVAEYVRTAASTAPRDLSFELCTRVQSNREGAKPPCLYLARQGLSYGTHIQIM